MHDTDRSMKTSVMRRFGRTEKGFSLKRTESRKLSGKSRNELKRLGTLNGIDSMRSQIDRLLAELFRQLQRASECKKPAAERLPMTPAISPTQPCPLNKVPPCMASSDSQRASTPKA